MKQSPRRIGPEAADSDLAEAVDADEMTIAGTRANRASRAGSDRSPGVTEELAGLFLLAHLIFVARRCIVSAQMCRVKHIEEPSCPEADPHSANVKKNKRDSRGKEIKPSAETSGNRQNQTARVTTWLNYTSMPLHKPHSSMSDKSNPRLPKRLLWILAGRRMHNADGPRQGTEERRTT